MTATDDRDYLPAMGRTRLLPLYDVFSRVMGAREPQWQLVAQAGIEPGARVLEIGCGTGTVLRLAALAVPGSALTGLDPDPTALALAARKLRRAGVPVRLDRGYADRLPYADGSVDRVLSAFMLHHLPAHEQDVALREVRRVLAPGGRLHLVDFDGRPAGPVGRLFHRPHGEGHGGGHGGGHRHGRDHLTFGRTDEALAAAGFADVRELARGTSRIGGHVFLRATP